MTDTLDSTIVAQYLADHPHFFEEHANLLGDVRLSSPLTGRALKAGAANFMTKPFDDEDLLNSIHQCMKVAALERRAETLERSLKSARTALHDR